MSAVYMMASRRHGTLYVGVTSDLLRRVSQHREGVFEGFTKRYGVKRLVWFEWHDSIEAAIHREKRLKEYPRQWKVNLVERDNPYWLDLFPGFFREEGPLSHLQDPVPPAQPSSSSRDLFAGPMNSGERSGPQRHRPRPSGDRRVHGSRGRAAG